MSLKMPAGKPGEPIYFPTIQKCAQGEMRWVQIPADGESEDDLESPAPAVVLTAAEAEHEPASTEVSTAGTSIDDDPAPEWLTIVALVLGALGAATGVAGLTAARRRSR
jgi:hypothetical protein